MDTIDIKDRAAELRNKAASLKAVTTAFSGGFVEGKEKDALFVIKAYFNDYQALFRVITEYVAGIAEETASFAADLEGCDFTK